MLVTGIDIIEISRIESISTRYGDRFFNRIYTIKEQEYCRGRSSQLASRFAAKEATMKALGTGVRGIGWKDIEVLRERGMAPYIKLHGRAIKRAEKMGLTDLTLSLSHSKEFAVASVIGNSGKGNLIPR